ncbi:hypothetical protein [Spiroplasma endosymbiont of Amphibalanus improvisus]|uniref:hypothetical protein n=1 Tax=Spiroplasma endosymbiont of Amphibalanus improvisus TaxID=3066327 RepID=UPI00313ACF81
MLDYVIDMIIDAIIRSITYAIVTSVTITIRNSIRKSISKSMQDKLEKFVGADGEIDEDKISSLIKVNVRPLGSGLYNVSVKEDVFGVLDVEIVSTKHTEDVFKHIKKELVICKIKAKLRKDNDKLLLIENLLEGFE